MSENELMEKWLKEVKNLGFVAKGSIRKFKRKCNKAGCKKCESGIKHDSHQMTYYLDGKQHTRFVGPKQLEQIRHAIENGRKLEVLLVQYGQEYLKLLKNPESNNEDALQ